MIARAVTVVFLEDKEQGVKANFNRRIFTLACVLPDYYHGQQILVLLLTSL